MLQKGKQISSASKRSNLSDLQAAVVEAKEKTEHPFPTEQFSSYPKHMKLLITLFLGISVCGLTYWAWNSFGVDSKVGPGTWVEVKARPLHSEINELGLVTAKNETTIFSGFTGEITWLIEEGTYVEPNTVIVRMDKTKVEEEIEQLEQQLFDKKDAVRDAREQLEALKKKLDLDVKLKESNLQQIKLNRDDVYAQPKPDELQRAQLQARSAELKYEKEQKTHDAHEELFKRGYVSDAVMKQKKLAIARAKGEWAKSKILLQLTEMGATNRTKRQYDLQVKEGEMSLETAKFDRESDLKIAQAELDLVQIDLNNFLRSIERKKMYLEEADVKAGVSGRVAFVDVYKGSGKDMGPIQVGESRNRGQDLCKVVDASVLRVQTWISEADITRVKPGMPAAIKLLAFPERTYQARVAEVGVIAKDKNVALSSLALKKAGEAFVNVVKVKLDFLDITEEERKQMRLRFSAQVKIDCGEIKDALVLPWTTIQYDETGDPFVWVKGSLGAKEARPVKLGISNPLSVQVKEGLQTNEMVFDLRKDADSDD